MRATIRKFPAHAATVAGWRASEPGRAMTRRSDHERDLASARSRSHPHRAERDLLGQRDGAGLAARQPAASARAASRARPGAGAAHPRPEPVPGHHPDRHHAGRLPGLRGRRGVPGRAAGSSSLGFLGARPGPVAIVIGHHRADLRHAGHRRTGAEADRDAARRGLGAAGGPAAGHPRRRSPGPSVWLLAKASTDLVVRLAGGDPTRAARGDHHRGDPRHGGPTADFTAGAAHASSAGAFEIADRILREILVPRRVLGLPTGIDTPTRRCGCWPAGHSPGAGGRPGGPRRRDRRGAPARPGRRGRRPAGRRGPARLSPARDAAGLRRAAPAADRAPAVRPGRRRARRDRRDRHHGGPGRGDRRGDLRRDRPGRAGGGPRARRRADVPARSRSTTCPTSASTSTGRTTATTPPWRAWSSRGSVTCRRYPARRSTWMAGSPRSGPSSVGPLPACVCAGPPRTVRWGRSIELDRWPSRAQTVSRAPHPDV